MLIDGPQDGFFYCYVGFQVLFHRADDVGDVGFAGVVQQTGKNNSGVPAAGFGFVGAVQAVLAYGVQLFHMTSAAAQKAQGVSDVFGSDVAVLDVHWIYQ